MQKPAPKVPDHTAVRVALWRALHLEVDAAPPVLEDRIGLALAAPDDQWRARPDMHPEGIRPYRAAILARARFIEDLATAKAGQGVDQYVILGAGLDTYALRRPASAAGLRIYEVDRPGPQAWKCERLISCGYGVPEGLRLVAVDFEDGRCWWDILVAAGFDPGRPAVVASTGVSMYLTREANVATLRQLARFARGSTVAMTFMLPLDLLDPSERPQHEAAYARAQAAGTPFLSFFRPEEMLALARDAGFATCSHVSTEDLTQRYFDSRSDGLSPGKGEEFLLATA